MRDIIYELTEEKHFISEREKISYGISVCDNATKEDAVTVIKYISNITTNKDKLEELVNKCNALKLSPMHILNVVEDLLK